MRSIGFILTVALIILGCTNKNNKTFPAIEIPEGSFYAEEYRHSDTITFQPRKNYSSNRRDWTSKLFWTITKDSIYQEDTRGHLDMMGMTKSSYKIVDDTLVLTFTRQELNFRSVSEYLQTEQSNDELKDSSDIINRYKILMSNDTIIQLVRLLDLGGDVIESRELGKEGVLYLK